MSETYRLFWSSRRFFQFMRFDEAVPRPRRERALTHEVEHPYRTSIGMAYRLTGRISLVLGQWGPPAADPDAHLAEALSGYDLDVPAAVIATW